MAFTILYDACVLYPAPLRDLLVELACTGLFNARWTNDIHEEWIRNVLEQRPDLTIERLTITRQNMDKAVLGALVTGYEPLIPALQLPDADDRHVLAAAIRAGAQVIVTFNLKDFPSATLEPFGVEVLHPDAFIMDAINLDATRVVNAVRTCQRRLRNPPRSMREHLDTLENQGLIRTVTHLKRYLLDAEQS
jgi:predicted nucleic acid-binding protein